MGLVIDATLPLRWDICLLGDQGLLPLCRISFSDDRRFIAATIEQVIELALECAQSSKRMGRIVNQDK